jgi:RNA polymerase sigma-54 factor
MKQNLNLGQGLSQQQQLNLAPQLLQWLRLLQAPAQHLEQMVRQELEINPALEENEDPEPVEDEFEDEFSSELDDGGDAEAVDERMELLAELGREWDNDESSVSSDDVVASQERMDYRMNSLTEAFSMRDRLVKQVGIMGLADDVKAAAELIVGTLDKRGYLDIPLPTLAEESGLAVATLEAGLESVQGCEPAGVGARDVKECLLLQLAARGGEAGLARWLVEDYLEAVAQNRLEAIAEHLDVELEEVEDAVAVVRSLNPYPGQSIDDGDPVVAVTPDVVLTLDEQDEFEIEIVERNVPRLRISHACRSLIEKGTLSKADLAYVRSRIRSAMFVIDGLRKREATMRRITEELIRVHNLYLRGREQEIRPLTMAKVAAIVGVHDTTVSRAIAEKFIQTPIGLLPMRHFFQTGYVCEDGSALTPDMVRGRIQKIIEEEEPGVPIKDEDIAELLRKDGIPVARRTVAKYRVELGLGSSKERAGYPGSRPAAAAMPSDLGAEEAGTGMRHAEEMELAFA